MRCWRSRNPFPEQEDTRLAPGDTSRALGLARLLSGLERKLNAEVGARLPEEVCRFLGLGLELVVRAGSDALLKVGIDGVRDGRDDRVAFRLALGVMKGDTEGGYGDYEGDPGLHLLLLPRAVSNARLAGFSPELRKATVSRASQDFGHE